MREEEETKKNIRLARQCFDFKNITCNNKNCLNDICPLNREYDYKVKKVKKYYKPK